MASKNAIPQNIQRIRVSLGLSQDEVAQGAGISRQAYCSIESGKSEPRVSNLQGIARALGVSLPELLVEPPQLSSVRFRSQKMRTARDRARRHQIIVDVSRWLKDFNILEDVIDQKQKYSFEGLSTRNRKPANANSPISMAAAARKALNVREDEPIRDICGLLESAGVKVRTVDIAAIDFFGLSVAAGDGGPGVVVNVRDDITVERRIFTAAHELGHLLLHPGAYDVIQTDEDPEEEKEADRFASHFLMPDGIFQREWRSTSGLPFVDRVLHVKRIFRVSYKTILFRLTESRLADDKVWMVFKAQYKQRFGRALGNKEEPMPLAEVDFLEDRLSRLVRQSLENGVITLSRAAEILGLDLNSMRERIASWEIAA